MNLPLTVAFPACSGATIPSLAQSVGGQPLQFSFLTGSTSLVTVMIGGNDTSIIGLTLRCLSAPFMSSDVACMNQQLVPQGPTFSQIIDSDLATLHTNLMKTYATIKDNAMQARVVAPTYPIPFPAPGSPFTCSVLGRPAGSATPTFWPGSIRSETRIMKRRSAGWEAFSKHCPVREDLDLRATHLRVLPG
jgi:hypothetical protein